MNYIGFIKAENGPIYRDIINTEDAEKTQIGDDSEDDVEIVEDENGQCTVRIKPKPIKLKIINLHGTQNVGTLNKQAHEAKKRKMSIEDSNSTNGHLKEASQFDRNLPAAKKPRTDAKESISMDPVDETTKAGPGRPKTPTHRDIRTHCDKVYYNYLDTVVNGRALLMAVL